MGNCSLKKEGEVCTVLSKNNFRFIHVIGKGGFGKVILLKELLIHLKVWSV